MSSSHHLNLVLFEKLSTKSYTELQVAPYPLWLPCHSYLPHTSLIKFQNYISTYKPTPLPSQLFLCHLHPSSTPLLHSCHLTWNRQFTLSVIWFILWSRSCFYQCTKENFQWNITNYPLNSKSFHNHRYLPFHLKIIYNQPTVKKPSLNKEDLSNYRPIANLFFISKLTEKNYQKAPSRPFNLQFFTQSLSICLYQILLHRDQTTFPTWPSFLCHFHATSLLSLSSWSICCLWYSRPHHPTPSPFYLVWNFL